MTQSLWSTEQALAAQRVTCAQNATTAFNTGDYSRNYELGKTLLHRNLGGSSVGPADDRHELLNLTSLIRLAARCDGVFDAMRYVISQNFLLNTPQSCANRPYLGNNIDAIAVLL